MVNRPIILGIAPKAVMAVNPAYGLKFAGTHTIDPKQLARQAAKRHTSPEVRAICKQKLEAAEQYLLARRQAGNGKPGFVVLDVDNTVFNYSPLYAEVVVGMNEQGEFLVEHGEGKGLRKVFSEGNPKPFKETIDFIKWLNKNRIPYCFLSGRIEVYRQRMEKQLEDAHVMGKGAPECFGLYLKPLEASGKVEKGPYKAQMRQKLQQEYGEILAAVGDQPVDLVENPQDPRANVLLPLYFPTAYMEQSHPTEEN